MPKRMYASCGTCPATLLCYTDSPVCLSVCFKCHAYTAVTWKQRDGTSVALPNVIQEALIRCDAANRDTESLYSYASYDSIGLHIRASLCNICLRSGD